MVGTKATAAACIATLVAFVVLDGVWLWLVGAELFKAHVGALLRPEPLLAAALAFYIVYAAGLWFLAVRPAVERRSHAVAAIHGAVVGATAYATFDLTNLAVLQTWSVGLAAIDIAWGVFASSVAAVVGYRAGLHRRS